MSTVKRHLRVLAITCATLSSVAPAMAQAFSLSSPDFAPGQALDAKFSFTGMGCNGANLSPALAWEHPPEGTKSFALMVHDPDAPTGGAGIWHWVVVDIPATARAIEQGAGTPDGAKLPVGSRQINSDYISMGVQGWGGPCPPPGQKPHNYNFTLYALGVEKLALSPTTTASNAGFFINRNALGRAKLTAVYGR